MDLSVKPLDNGIVLVSDISLTQKCIKGGIGILKSYLNNKIFPIEDKLNDDDVYYTSLLSCYEMIKTGTTTFNDMFKKKIKADEYLKNAKSIFNEEKNKAEEMKKEILESANKEKEDILNQANLEKEDILKKVQEEKEKLLMEKEEKKPVKKQTKKKENVPLVKQDKKITKKASSKKKESNEYLQSLKKSSNKKNKKVKGK